MPSRPAVYRPPSVRQSALAAVQPRLRGTTKERGYDQVWKRVRADHLRREPLCRKCRELCRAVPGIDVDHIIPIALRPDLRLDDENLQTLCETHHSQKTRQENRK